MNTIIYPKLGYWRERYAQEKARRKQARILADIRERPENEGSPWGAPSFPPRKDGKPEWWSILEWDARRVSGWGCKGPPKNRFDTHV